MILNPLDIFAKLRAGLEVALILVIVGLSLATWYISGKYEKLLEENATLTSEKNVAEVTSKSCSDATEKAALIDAKKARDVKEAQERVVGMANVQVQLAQDLLNSKPKTSDLCKESYDLLEKYLVDLKKEETKK